ncbi:hypothetical protein ScalyP_jg11102, partial [Parmales sp. scaly parma]
ASFVVRWLGADGSVKHASSEDLGSKLATKLKALTKDEAKKWLDQYYKLNKYLEVLILLGSQIRTTQLRAMTLRSGVNAPRSVKFIPFVRSEDNVCCKAICLTEKQKVGSGGSSGLSTNIAALCPTASVAMALQTTFRSPVVQGFADHDLR